ncbi:O-acyltransferase like protein-like [Amblyomma americanum]
MNRWLWLVLVASATLGPLALASPHDDGFVRGRNSSSNASLPPVPAESSSEDKATGFRRLAANLAGSVPPWMRQKLAEAPVSTQCSLGLLRMLRGISNLEPWALRMFDSTGKVPSGLFTGTVTELGSFDECLSTVWRDDNGREVIRAQYCSLFIRIDNDTSVGELLMPGLLMTHEKASLLLSYQSDPRLPGFRWGICVVSDCAEEELQAVAHALIGDTVTVSVRYCMADVTLELTPSQASVVAILATVLFLMVAATIVDAYASEEVKRTAIASVLRSFSVPANLRLLSSTPEKTSESYQLRFMHGVRAVSIAYIVYGHSMIELSFATTGSTNNLSYMDRYDSTLSMAAFMAVDTFFFLSGYLLSRTLCGLKNARGVKAFAVIALRRWYRLVLPLVFFACCFSLLPLFVTGPTTAAVYDKFYADVQGHWWALVFNVRNMFAELTYGLNAHTWYISADYQLFFLALLVHQLHGKRFIIASLALLSIAGSSFTAWQMYGTRYSPVIVHLTETYDDYLKMLSDVYMLPTYHAVCYFGGCITFYVVEKFKSEKISKVTEAALWVVVIGFSAACVFYRFDWTNGTKHGDLAKVSLAFWDRILFSLSIAAFTFLCATERGGVVQKTLSAAPLAVLSRLSYGVYLIHFVFYAVSRTASREMMYVSVFSQLTESVQVFVWSCMLSLVLFLACEAPVGRLDKIIWSAPRKDKDQHANGGHDIELTSRHKDVPE